MSAIYFVSFLFLLFSNFHPRLCESDFKECNPDGVTVNITSGAISLPVESGKNCTWILNLDSAAKDRVEAFLFLETIRFESGDSLLISSINENNVTSLLANLTDSISNNLFFTGTKKNLIINLSTSASSASSRSFHLFLEAKKNSAPIPILDDTVLKLLPLAGEPDVAGVDWTFKLALSANKNKKKIAASVDNVSADITVKFDKPWTNDSPDFLSENDKIEFGLKIKDISFTNNSLAISVYSVTDVCSSHVSLTDKNSVTTVEVNSEKLQNLIDVKCLWIIESDDLKHWLNINFDSKEPIDVKAGNSFIVRKGNRKSSPVLFVISSSNFNDIRSNIYNSIFDSSSLYITYEAFETHGEHPHFDVIRPVVKNYIIGDQKLDLSTPNMPTKFLFKAKANNNAVLSALGQTFFNTTYVYDQPILSPDNLLAVFNEKDVFPENLWSDSDLLILDFTSIPSKLTIELKSQPSNLGSTARQSKGSLVLFSNQLDCKSLYNWFIPPRHTKLNDDYKIVKSLVISNLALEKGGSMTLTSFASDTKPHEYTITGENAMTLPPFYLDASISHSIKYQRADVCDKNSITLIQASIDTISYDACTNIEVDAKQDFVSCNYPNNYPLTEWTMSKNCRHMNSTSSNIYISFIDVDLVNGHSLEFLAPGSNINLTLSNIPGDMIVSNKVAINFNRVFNNDEKTSKTLKDKLSGRGFKTTVEPIECGNVFANKTGSFSMNGTDKSEKCIWIIQTPIEDPKTIKLLNFTLSDSLKSATVYDSNSRKNGHILNITGAGYYNSTTETIIVEFTTSSKPVQINWSTLVCSDPCLGARRCINPSERCNGVNDCGDWSDELHCNGTAPIPPEPKIIKSGVPGLVVVFVIMPLSIIFGILATIMAPRIMARIRGGQYQEFREYSDVS